MMKIKKITAVILAVTMLLSVVLIAPFSVSAVESGGKFTVNLNSNYFPAATCEFDAETKQFTVSCGIQSDINMLNVQWVLFYDKTLLCPSSENDDSTVIPAARGNAIASFALPAGVTGAEALPENTDRIKACASNVRLYNTSSSKKDICKVVFNVIADDVGNVETTLNFRVDVLSFSKVDGEGYNIKSEERCVVESGAVDPYIDSYSSYPVVTVFEPEIYASESPSETASSVEESSSATETSESTEPSTATEPTESSEPSTATEPTESSEPSTATDPTESSESSTATEPIESSDPSTATEPSSETTESSSETEPIAEYKFGDVNLDGEVNVKDATLIQRIAVEDASLELSDIQRALADVDGDLKTNVKDATCVLLYSVESVTGTGRAGQPYTQP